MRKPMTYEDAVAVGDYCPDVERVAVEIYPQGFPPVAKYRGQEIANAQFLGATPEDFAINNSSFVDGRPYTEVENIHRRNVAVIGADVAKTLFENEDPIHKEFTVGGSSFRIIGVLGKRLGVLGNSGNDRTIYVPYRTLRKIYPAAKENLILASAYPNRMAEAVDEITTALRRTRRVKPDQPNNFGKSTAASVIRQFNQIRGFVALVMVALSSIGLLVGGIGVMNITLVSVTERTREIGIRKAVGARRHDITWQFLLEAMTPTGGGGCVGDLPGLPAQPYDSSHRAQPPFLGAALVRCARFPCFSQHRLVLRVVAGNEGFTTGPDCRPPSRIGPENLPLRLGILADGSLVF